MERAGRPRSRPHARSGYHRQDGAEARTPVRGHRHIRRIHRNRARKAGVAWIRAARAGWRKPMPANRIGNSDWVVCRGDRGFAIADGEPESMMSRFPQNSLGVVEGVIRNSVQVFLPGQGESYRVSADSVERIDLAETGGERPEKICGVCFILKNTDEFSVNRINARRRVRRPICKQRRLDIDRRNMSRHAREEARRNMPPRGTLWRCPICRKWSIVGVTAKARRGATSATDATPGLDASRTARIFSKNAISYLRQAEDRRG